MMLALLIAIVIATNLTGTSIAKPAHGVHIHGVPACGISMDPNGGCKP